MTNNHCNNCFLNFSVDSRMQIFLFLKENGEQSVSRIVDEFKLSQPTISYHLKTMADAGILSKKRVGKEILYAVNESCPKNNKTCMLKQFNFTK